jgi:DNA-binding IclR family transcriptional regulator
MSSDGPPPSILSKAFDLLSAFNSGERIMTLTELAEASGLPKSTVHRLLARLIELGAVEHHRSGYRIGLALFQLASVAPAVGMRDLAVPHLAALHRLTGHTVHLGVLRGFDVVYLEKVPAARSKSVPVGARLPANCTAIGKVLLAHGDLDTLAATMPDPLPRMTPSSVHDAGALLAELREVRDRGVAVEHEESRLGIGCLAAPVTPRQGAVAAISMSNRATTSLRDDESALRATATQIATVVRESLYRNHAHWFPQGG